MDRMLQETMTFVNGVRAALGREPEPTLRYGRIKNAHSCPISRTIGFGAVTQDRCIRLTERPAPWLGAKYRVSDSGVPRWEVRFPKEVRKFIRRFDEGLFPEYDEAELRKLLGPIEAPAPELMYSLTH